MRKVAKAVKTMYTIMAPGKTPKFVSECWCSSSYFKLVPLTSANIKLWTKRETAEKQLRERRCFDARNVATGMRVQPPKYNMDELAVVEIKVDLAVYTVPQLEAD